MASQEHPIAIIGIACRLPKAKDCREFWELMDKEVDCVEEFPLDRRKDIQHVMHLYKNKLKDPNSPFFSGAFFTSVDQFDAPLFGINSNEAVFIEPEQRIFLETTWELFEDAGVANNIKGSKTGIYVGYTVNKYKYLLTENHPSVSHGNHSPFIASRVSYVHDLHGPAMMVAVGCSSSLLAVHLACQGIVNGDCEMAVAGGITLDLLPISTSTDIWNQLGITGPDVRCRAFDSKANGIAKGEGCGAVLLKPLDAALKDNNHIYGVLRGSVANHDGHSNGITAPHPGAQTKMLVAAWTKAGISPNKLGYFEAHGTGTELGDPIEVSAIHNAFKEVGATINCRKIPIGSVKSNIGHLADGAAGVLSLIKVLLSFEHESIPASIHVTEPNKHINWKRAPVEVIKERREWKKAEDGRLASVSAFGLLGTNVHVVLEDSHKGEKKENKAVENTRQAPLMLAANSRISLQGLVQKLQYFLTLNSFTARELSRLLKTLNFTRRQDNFHHRAVVQAESQKELVTNMEELALALCGEPVDAILANTICYTPVIGKDKSIITESHLEGGLDFQEIVKRFFDGGVCKAQESFTPFPQLPSYSFDRRRYWPNISKPLIYGSQLRSETMSELDVKGNKSKEKNRLDDVIEIQSDVDTTELTVVEDVEQKGHIDAINSHAQYLSDQKIKCALTRSLNKALGVEINWSENKEKNLFELGLDSMSLAYTLASLSKETGMELNVCMKNFHSNPRYTTIEGLVLESFRSGAVADVNREGGSFNTKEALLERQPNRYNLHPSQQRLWVLHKLSPDSPVYNATNAFILKGPLESEMFVAAVNATFYSNAASFTQIFEDEDGPYQTIDIDLDIAVKEKDLRHQANPNSSALDYYKKDYETPFKLQGEPMLRITLYRTGDEEWFFTLVIHHIIFDGWSHFVIFNDIWRKYHAHLAQGKVQLCEPSWDNFNRPIYAEVASDTRRESKEDLEYWLANLASSPEPVTIPGDKDRPLVFTQRGGRITEFFDKELINKLKEFSVANNCTMFQVLLAVLNVLIYLYSDEADISVGSPIAGRDDADVAGVMGLFVNTLVLRTNLGTINNFKDVVSAVKSTTLSAFQHSKMQFDQLVKLLDPERDTSSTPLFKINICHHNTELRRDMVSPPKNIEIERRLIHNSTSKWDLYFDFLMETSSTMRFTLEYYSDLYSEQLAKEISANYKNLLDILIKKPSCDLKSLIKETSLRKVVTRKSIVKGVTRDIGRQSLATNLFEVLDVSPADVTDMSSMESTSVQRIHRNAIHVSYYMSEVCHVGRGSRIAILLENGPYTFVGLLSCLYGGYSFVPLDPNHPKARIEELTNRAGIVCIMCDKSTLSTANHLRWICRDVRNVILLGEDSYDDSRGESSPLMEVSLWDSVATLAEDSIQGGGWKNSYTDEYFTKEEMSEYSKNVYQKLHPYLREDTSQVLEIGCSSGLTTAVLAPLCKTYVATDLSKEMIEIAKQRIGAKNVVYKQCEANKIGQKFKGQKFNVVILNSVAHCFPSHNYFYHVINDCIHLLKDDGVLFVGDVMALEKRGDLIRSTTKFKENNPAFKVKTNWSNELFLSQEFLQAVCDESQELKSVEFSSKIHTVKNELTEFRFDALFRRGRKEGELDSKPGRCQEITFTSIRRYTADINEEMIKRKVLKLAKETGPYDEAYVLFTSGTSGSPKGVCIPQQALKNYVTWAVDTYELSEASHIPLFSPLTFDFTITSIFPPLLAKASIYTMKNFIDFQEQLRTFPNFTFMKLAPLQLDTLLFIPSCKPFSACKFVLGGETLEMQSLLNLKRIKGKEHFEVWNEYGPTEATVGCIAARIDSTEISPEMKTVPIGIPIQNVTVSLTNQSRKVVKAGIKGTICISGPCLLTDYIGSVNVSERLERAPWEWMGGKMLVTYDIGVLQNNGEILCFGRTDVLCKINNIRIDTEEVQARISSFREVKQSWVTSVVINQKETLGAVMILEKEVEDQTSFLSSLQDYLRCHLPDTYVPKVFAIVGKPLLNANGKVDKGKLKLALQDSATKWRRRDEGMKKELTKVEIDVIESFRQVLPIESIDYLDQDFFNDLGGDSLLAIHVVRKLQYLKYKVTTLDLFTQRTARRLIQTIDTANGHEEDRLAEESELNDPNFLQKSFAPVGILHQYLSRHRTKLETTTGYSLSLLLHFDFPVETSLLKEGVKHLCHIHPILRSRIEYSDGDFVIRYAEEGDFAETEVIAIQGDRGQLQYSAELHRIFDKYEAKLNMMNGYTMYPVIMTQEASTYVLLLLHHGAVDIVSQGILIDNLASFLRGDCTVKPEIGYQEYCGYIRGEHAVDVYEKEVEYWNSQVDKNDIKSIKNEDLPCFSDAKWSLKEFEAENILRIKEDLGITTEALLLTCAMKAWELLTNQSNVTLCLESHGRQCSHLNMCNAVGWFTSQFPMAHSFSSDHSLQDNAKAINDHLQDIPNKGFGFGVLQQHGYYKGWKPELTFVYQGQTDTVLSETRSCGRGKVRCVYWADALLEDLRNGKFHRHECSTLDHACQVITWISGDTLKVGCLYSKSSFTDADITNFLSYFAKMLQCFINEEAKEIQIISDFELTEEFKKHLWNDLLRSSLPLRSIHYSSPVMFMQELHHVLPETFACRLVLTVSDDDNTCIALKDAVSKSQNKSKCHTRIIDCSPKGKILEMIKRSPTCSVQRLPKTILGQSDAFSQAQYCMPFSVDGYEALRCFSCHNLLQILLPQKPYKVIAVDGDYTLWNGECANDDIEMKEMNKYLQEFLKRKRHEGFLLVLLTKNDVLDVEATFQKHSEDFLLTLEDFVLVYANWSPKSENLHCASEKLNLHLSNFVFIDDNVLECSEIVRECPIVLTILFEGAKWSPEIFNFLWSLDNTSSSEMDRTVMYRQEFDRKAEIGHFLSDRKVLTIDELLHNWEMKLSVLFIPVAEVHLYDFSERVEELLTRTNQFRLNLKNSISSCPDDHCLLGSLRDKFGNYGIVSVILFNCSEGDLLDVKQWVLSCRALGRRTEEAILQSLSTAFTSSRIKFHLEDTRRNKPMVDFLQNKNCFEANVKDYVRENIPFEVTESKTVKEFQETLPVKQTYEAASNSNRKTISLKSLQHVLQEWPESIKNQAQKQDLYPLLTFEKAYQDASLSDPLAQVSCLEGDLSSLVRNAWNSVLEITYPIEDNTEFVTLGGTSHKAVFLAATLRKSCQIDITVLDIFKNSTLKNLILAVNRLPHLEPKDQGTNVATSGREKDDAVYLTRSQIRLLSIQELYSSSTSYTESLLLWGDLQLEEARELSRQLYSDFAILSTEYDFDSSTLQPINVSLEVIDESLSNELEAEQYLIDSTPALGAKGKPLCIARYGALKDASFFVIHVHHALADDIGQEVIGRKMWTHFLECKQQRLLKGKKFHQEGKNCRQYQVRDKKFADDENQGYVDTELRDCQFQPTSSTSFQDDHSNLHQLHNHMRERQDPKKGPACQKQDACHKGQTQQERKNGRQCSLQKELRHSQTIALRSEEDYYQSDRYRKDQVFWQQTFVEVPPISSLSLETDSVITWNNTTSYEAAFKTALISETVLNDVKRFCLKHQLTEFQYALAVFCLCVSEYTSSEDILIAIPVSQRTEEDSKILGSFVNTVLFKTKLDHSLNFPQFAKIVSDIWVDVFAHANYPIEDIGTYIWKKHGVSPTHCMNIMFNMASRKLPEAIKKLPAKHAKVPFSLDILKYEQQTAVCVEWATNLIDSCQASRFLDSYMLALAYYCSHPDSLPEVVSCVSIVQQKELNKFNRKAVNTDLSTFSSVVEAFEKNVQQHPNGIAIQDGNRSWSYKCLDVIATRIASNIQERLPGSAIKEKPVAIMMEMSAKLISVIIGVWKAGGHFINVSRNSSGLSNEGVISSVNACLLVHEDESSDGMLSVPCVPYSNLITVSVANIVTRNVRQCYPCYIIRTSGSTGTPKTCVISHENALTVAEAWRSEYQLNAFDVCSLQWAPCTFDVFVGDLIRTLLCCPGTLVLCSTTQRLDVHKVAELIQHHKVNLMEVTPQFAHALVTQCANQLSSLRILVIGSDVLKWGIFEEIQSKMQSSVRVINSYGMTEATIDSAYFSNSDQLTNTTETVPIGRPLPGVEFYVVNQRTKELCPIGAPGELYISGPVIASGDVDLVKLDYAISPCLKTGDAARWLPSGHIELLGRLDSMVKLRGFRISTTEIEKHVASVFPVNSVHAAVLTSCPSSTDFLVVYVVLKSELAGSDNMITCQELRERLAGRLPHYMLPDFIVHITELPLSENGKVDYKQLPSINEILSDCSQMSVIDDSSDWDDIMKTIGKILAEVIGMSSEKGLQLDRTFMEQGAHSLILIRFCACLNSDGQYDVTIADLFSYPTIRALSNFIRRKSLESSLTSQPTVHMTESNCKVAITGLSVHLPSRIETLPELWKALETAEDLTTCFPSNRLNDALPILDDITRASLCDEDICQGIFFNSIDLFDAEYFGISRSEAVAMAPEQRLFLETSIKCLQDAGILKTIKGENVGVYVGVSEISYGSFDHNEATSIPGTMPSVVPTRLAYHLNLVGPTMVLDTACSSSLLALQKATEDIEKGNCQSAIVGGVSLQLLPIRRGVFGKASILSNDFKCKAFDADASGTSVGEGVISLYLEPLDQAVARGAHTYGVIEAISSNNSGHTNGITAPSALAQEQVINDTLSKAMMRPSDISVLETHGTGTKLGDEVEISALKNVFKDHSVILGATKPTFGHLDAAAGLLGVVKTLASFEARKIPPIQNLNKPKECLLRSKLVAPPEIIPITEPSINVGISSFGLSGTNCHVILSRKFERDRNDMLPNKGKCVLFVTSFDGNHLIQELASLETYLLEYVQDNMEKLKLLAYWMANNIIESLHTKYRPRLKVAVRVENVQQVLRDIKKIKLEIGASEDRFLVNSKESLVTEIEASISGLSSKNSHIPRLPAVPFDVFRRERYWVESSQMMKSTVAPMGPGELISTKLEQTRELIHTLRLSPPSGLKEAQHEFCSSIVLKFFKETPLSSILCQSSKVINFEDAFKLTGMHERYMKLFFVMVRHLEEDGIITDKGKCRGMSRLKQFSFTGKLDSVGGNPDELAEKCYRAYPSYADCFRFPLYCSQHYHDVLIGSKSPISVIYPKGNLNFMYQFDKVGDVLGDIYYNMYMQIVGEFAQTLSRQRKGSSVRVLEVGAGVGFVTRQLLPKLQQIPNIEYWFTDLGKAFVENAKTLFAEYIDMMRFSTFDITRSPSSQGILGQYDIVVSYNVIHTTQSVKESVSNLRNCLSKDGMLFVIESAKNETWSTLAWGLLDGWWYFQDYELRPHDPMLDSHTWLCVLKEAGLHSVYTVPSHPEEIEHVEKCMFACSLKARKETQQDVRGWWETGSSLFDPKDQVNCIDESDIANQDLTSLALEDVILEVKRIWQELLGATDINIDDDFSSLGGESLVGIQMLEFVRKRLGYQLEIADTYCYPTLGELSKFIFENLLGDEATMEKVDEERTEPKPVAHCPQAVNDRKLCLLFPGQGSQKLDMLQRFRNDQTCAHLFENARRVLGYDLLEICNDEDLMQPALLSTEFVQIALYCGSVAAAQCVLNQSRESVVAVAGLSVGEFAALCVTGVITFEDGLRIVQERGKLMEKEILENPSGMLSVYGPGAEELAAYLEAYHQQFEISTYLADNQHTVAGSKSNLQRLLEDLKTPQCQLDIIDVRMLRVSGGFHSQFMRNASAPVRKLIEGCPMQAPDVPVIMNVSGKPTSSIVEIKEQLQLQLESPVQWKTSMISAYNLGCRYFTEVSPGRVLSTLVKTRIQAIPNVEAEWIRF